MLQIKVTYNNKIVFNITYPADKCTIRFSNDIIYVLTGKQTIQLNTQETLNSDNITLARKALDIKDKIIDYPIQIETIPIEETGFIKFYNDAPFSILHPILPYGYLEYSYDTIDWNIMPATNISARKCEDTYYLFIRGRNIKNLGCSNEQHWIISGSAFCEGNLLDLIDYTKINTTVYEGCFAYWLKDQNILSLPKLSEIQLKSSIFRSTFEGCKLLTEVPELPSCNIPNDAYNSMFRDSGITNLPILPANILGERCYQDMFSGTQIKLSEIKTDEYQYEYQIPVLGEVSTSIDWNKNMFYNTKGTYTSDPISNRVYYTNIKPTRDYNILYFQSNGGSGYQQNSISINKYSFIAPQCHYYHSNNTFNGWSRDFGNEIIMPEQTIIKPNDTQLTALWKSSQYTKENLHSEFLFNEDDFDSTGNNTTISNFHIINKYIKDDVQGQISYTPIQTSDWAITFKFKLIPEIQLVNKFLIHLGEHGSILNNDRIQCLCQLSNQQNLSSHICGTTVNYPLDTSYWHNIVITQNYIDGYIIIYYDGKEYQRLNNILIQPHGYLQIGDKDADTTDVYLSNIRLYNKYINSLEAEQLYMYG